MDATMKLLRAFLRAAIAGLAAFCACSVGPFAGGNSSQTGNNGVIVTANAGAINGTTRPQARVWIYETGYKAFTNTPGFADSTVADDSGRFSFLPAAASGPVNLLVRDTDGVRMAFLGPIPLSPDSLFADTVPSLMRPGYCAGNTTDTAGRSFALAYVYIQGSPFYAVTRNNGDFLLGPLPTGAYRLSIMTNFQVIDPKANTFTPVVVGAFNDTKSIVIMPDSITQWQW